MPFSLLLSLSFLIFHLFSHFISYFLLFLLLFFSRSPLSPSFASFFLSPYLSPSLFLLSSFLLSTYIQLSISLSSSSSFPPSFSPVAFGQQTIGAGPLNEHMFGVALLMLLTTERQEKSSRHSPCPPPLGWHWSPMAVPGPLCPRVPLGGDSACAVEEKWCCC